MSYNPIGGLKCFRKVFAGWSESFILLGGCIVVGDNFVGGGHGILKENLKLHNPSILAAFYQYFYQYFNQVYHTKIFRFSFIYFSSIENVIALSILYVKHPNKHNNQFNAKELLKEKKIPIHVKLGVT